MEKCPFCGLNKIFGIEEEIEYSCGTIIKGDTSERGYACIEITQQADLLRQVLDAIKEFDDREDYCRKCIDTLIALIPALEAAQAARATEEK